MRGIDEKVLCRAFLDDLACVHKNNPIRHFPGKPHLMGDNGHGHPLLGEFFHNVKNLTDHFLEEWFWRPAAIASYSAARFAGARAAMAWHCTLSEMGMIVVSSTLAAGPVAQTFSEDGRPTGEGGKAITRAFARFADDLIWWVEAAKAQRARKKPPY